METAVDKLDRDTGFDLRRVRAAIDGEPLPREVGTVAPLRCLPPGTLFRTRGTTEHVGQLLACSDCRAKVRVRPAVEAVREIKDRTGAVVDRPRRQRDRSRVTSWTPGLSVEVTGFEPLKELERTA
jgi:hypothetical protein